MKMFLNETCVRLDLNNSNEVLYSPDEREQGNNCIAFVLAWALYI